MTETASCIYAGTLRHRRFEPNREFHHPLELFYVDLAELSGLLDGRLVRPAPGLVRFRREDYHGDPAVPLTDSVRATVEARSGLRTTGPVRLLTNPRSFGHCFNPVSFYYCFSADGSRLEAIMAEVTNTPWGERYSYVIAGDRAELDKALHVSPFFGTDQRYRWRAPAPGRELQIVIENFEDSEESTGMAGAAGSTGMADSTDDLAAPANPRQVFAASLAMRRKELTPASLRAFNRRYPLASLRVLTLIYGHALGVRLAGVRTVPHPAATDSDHTRKDSNRARK